MLSFFNPLLIEGYCSVAAEHENKRDFGCGKTAELPGVYALKLGQSSNERTADGIRAGAAYQALVNGILISLIAEMEDQFSNELLVVFRQIQTIGFVEKRPMKTSRYSWARFSSAG